MLNIGFIGLGLMGQGMATNLIKHNFSLTIMAHRNRAPIEALCQLGANEVETPAVIHKYRSHRMPPVGRPISKNTKGGPRRTAECHGGR